MKVGILVRTGIGPIQQTESAMNTATVAVDLATSVFQPKVADSSWHVDPATVIPVRRGHGITVRLPPGRYFSIKRGHLLVPFPALLLLHPTLR